MPSTTRFVICSRCCFCTTNPQSVHYVCSNQLQTHTHTNTTQYNNLTVLLWVSYFVYNTDVRNENWAVRSRVQGYGLKLASLISSFMRAVSPNDYYSSSLPLPLLLHGSRLPIPSSVQLPSAPQYKQIWEGSVQNGDATEREIFHHKLSKFVCSGWRVKCLRGRVFPPQATSLIALCSLRHNIRWQFSRPCPTSFNTRYKTRKITLNPEPIFSSRPLARFYERTKRHTQIHGHCSIIGNLHRSFR